VPEGEVVGFVTESTNAGPRPPRRSRQDPGVL